MAEVEAIILAAGLGSRLGDCFRGTQKCMLPIDGKPILIHILGALVEAFGSVNAYIGIGYKAEMVVEGINRAKPRKTNITYINNCDRGIPDAHLNIEPHIRGSFVSLPGDVIARPEAYVDVLQLFELSRPDVAMVLSPRLNEANTHAVAKLDGIKVIEYLQPAPPTLDPDHLRNLTIYASDKRLFGLIKRHIAPPGIGLSHIFTSGFNELDLVGVNYQQPWIHVARQEDLTKSLRLEERV